MRRQPPVDFGTRPRGEMSAGGERGISMRPSSRSEAIEAVIILGSAIK